MHWRLPLTAVTILTMLSLAPTQAAETAAPTTQPLIVAHRGASFEAPENTLAAFNLAWQENADAIEGDFWLTKDGHVVCLHDESLKRTTGVDRKVGDMTLAEIKELDAGSWKKATYAGERIPTFDEVLASIPPGKLFFVEIKGKTDVVAAVAKIVAAQSHVSPSQLRVISFGVDNIAASKREMPNVAAFWLASFKAPKDQPDAPKQPTLPEVLAKLAACNADGLDANAAPDVINASFAAALKEKGYALHVWTVDDPERAKLMARAGTQSVTTNRPAFIREALK